MKVKNIINEFKENYLIFIFLAILITAILFIIYEFYVGATSGIFNKWLNKEVTKMKIKDAIILLLALTVLSRKRCD